MMVAIGLRAPGLGLRLAKAVSRRASCRADVCGYCPRLRWGVLNQGFHYYPPSILPTGFLLVKDNSCFLRSISGEPRGAV